MKKTLVKGIVYDKFQCKVCEKISDRHSNAAQVSIILLEQVVHEQHIPSPSPLTMGQVDNMSKFIVRVYSLLNKDVPRKSYIYARVSTYKQKNNLNNQIDLLKTFRFQSGYKINGIYSDIASDFNI